MAIENASPEDLPIVELPGNQPGPFMTIVLSGDGGWRDLDKQIGEWLAAHGVAVIGLDSLRYFWTEKEPPVIARDLSRLAHHYAKKWNRQKLLLVGYSFGADVLPATIPHLAGDVMDDLVQISLLGLETQGSFQFSVVGWLGQHGSDAIPTAPAARNLDMSKVQCFYGEQEDDSLCPDPLFDKAERIRTTGGHHFDGDYDHLAELILQGALRRSGSAK